MNAPKLGLAAVALSLGMSFVAPAAEREKTTPEIVAEARANGKSARVRTSAIMKLSEITDAAQVRDFKVVEELTALAGDANADMFVRTAAIEALGKIQINVTTAKDKFLPVFITALKDIKLHLLVRKAVADSLRDVLATTKGLVEKDAYKICVEISKATSETPGLRASCVDVIGIYSSDDALDVLVPLLSDKEPIIVEHAAASLYSALNRMGDREIPLPATNKLVEMLDSKTVAAELKVNVMKVLAQIMREGKTKAADPALPKIIDFVKNAQDDKLVRGGIEALGIIATAAAVEPLKQAYLDYKPAAAAAPAAGADPAKGEDGGVKKQEKAKETDIRMAVMDALCNVLNTQGEKKTGFDQKAVHESTGLLVKAAEEDPAKTVQAAAVFALRYLYYPKFKAEHKDVVDMLTFKIRDTKSDDEMKVDINKTLQAITGQDFGIDGARWDKWFQDNMGGGRKAPK
jgi:HEAT repeat protein